MLRPAAPSDRRRVYAWHAKSDVTPSMMGPPDYADLTIPTCDEFCADYLPHYFDDSAPCSGRCFIIVVDRQDVGVVCYNAIDEQRRLTELDIWLRAEVHCGKGYGSDALRRRCAHLHEAYGVEEFIVRPSRRNRRAIAAYRRGGFELLSLTPAEQRMKFGEGDCGDSVLLLKRLPRTVDALEEVRHTRQAGCERDPSLDARRRPLRTGMVLSRPLECSQRSAPQRLPRKQLLP